jgi:hypothetical protein
MIALIGLELKQAVHQIYQQVLQSPHLFRASKAFW